MTLRLSGRAVGVRLAVSIFILAALCACRGFAQEAKSGERYVVILHVNDQHSKIKHVDALKTIVDNFREQYEKNVLLLNGGDITIARARWESYKVINNLEEYTASLKLMVDSMNKLGFNAYVPGNHDLSYETTVTRDILNSGKFVVLGANLDVATDDYVKPKPYENFTMPNGIRVTVLGLCGGHFLGNNSGLKLNSPGKAIAAHKQLRDSCDAFVLLTHVGTATDKKLANQFGELIDVIVGGHSHTMINPPAVENRVLIAQTADGYGKPDYLGVIRLTFDAKGKVTDKQGEVLTVDGDRAVPSRFLDKAAK